MQNYEGRFFASRFSFRGRSVTAPRDYRLSLLERTAAQSGRYKLASGQKQTTRDVCEAQQACDGRRRRRSRPTKPSAHDAACKRNGKRALAAVARASSAGRQVALPLTMLRNVLGAARASSGATSVASLSRWVPSTGS